VQLLIIILCLLPGLVRAEHPEGNQLLLERTLLEKLDSALVSVPFDTNGIRITIGSVQGEKRGFLNQVIRKYLSKRDVRVDNRDAAYEWIIEQFETDVVYKQKVGSLFGFSDTFERKLGIKLVGWINTSDGEMIRYLNIAHTKKDRIKDSDISEVEHGPYRFLKGKMIDSSLWTRAIEPAMVIISVSTVVYLFFTMRS
jgi:hypothetical protein